MLEDKETQNSTNCHHKNNMHAKTFWCTCTHSHTAVTAQEICQVDDYILCMKMTSTAIVNYNAI